MVGRRRIRLGGGGAGKVIGEVLEEVADGQSAGLGKLLHLFAAQRIMQLFRRNGQIMAVADPGGDLIAQAILRQRRQYTAQTAHAAAFTPGGRRG